MAPSINSALSQSFITKTSSSSSSQSDMPPAPRRLVRQRPLSERIQAFLNPIDFYIWLSEEIQSFDWDSTSFGTWFGLVANFLFLLARANGNIGGGVVDDDVFSDAPSSGFTKALVS